jgi:hypothetical protein
MKFPACGQWFDEKQVPWSYAVVLCRRPIFLVRATRHYLERIVWQRPLLTLPRRAHPYVARFLGCLDHPHRLRVNRLDDAVRSRVGLASGGNSLVRGARRAVPSPAGARTQLGAALLRTVGSP